MRCLSDREYERLRPYLKPVELVSGEVLQQPGSNQSNGYFVESGLISVQALSRTHRPIGTNLIGPEGFWGLLPGSSSMQAVVQISGKALAISAEHLELFNVSKELLCWFFRFSRFQNAQAAHVGACNAIHQVRERLARSLLMVAATIRSYRFALRHAVIAQMLGAERTTISASAEELKAARLINYSRGKIEIINRVGLERAACRCYRVLRAQLEQYLSV